MMIIYYNKFCKSNLKKITDIIFIRLAIITILNNINNLTLITTYNNFFVNLAPITTYNNFFINLTLMAT
jgi:hypothetical protein